MNEHYETTLGDYFISTNPLLLDIKAIHRYLSQDSYWAQNIPYETVERSVRNSLSFGLYYQPPGAEREHAGFARLITDRATFAYLADVHILPEHRGKGLSKWLMEAMHAHPELQTLRRWLLGTKDAHGLYEQFGWTRFTEEQLQRFMQYHNPDVYKKKGE